MVLMKPGVWHDNVFADRTWPENLWGEYGAAAPPPPPPTTTTFGGPAPRPDFPVYLLKLVLDYLEAKAA